MLQFVNTFRTELQQAIADKNHAKVNEIVSSVDAALGSNSYVIGNQISISDIFLYAAIFPIIVRWKKL